ncbi:MAG: MATE family efflux transporter, partial [Bacteroidaceae bacterium]|nr:MATE family efflux transporter [Bacteroidaceae bacterium]
VWTIILLFPEAVIRIFTPDVAIIASGVPPLYILGASYIFQVPGQILFMSVSGTGNTRTALAIEVLSLVVYVWYVWYFIYELRSSLSVAWGSEVIYAFIILIFSYAYFRWGKWHHKQI